MKLVIKMLLFMVVFGLAGPYLLMGPDGMKKLMLIKDMMLDTTWSAPSLPSALDVTESNNSGQQWIEWSDQEKQWQPDQLTPDQLAQIDLPVQANIYYRWQDESGVWQFSELPNRNTLNMVVRTDPNANVLQGLSEEQIDSAFGRLPKNTNSIVENNPLANGEGLESNTPVPATIPLSEIPKLIEQAKDVQKIMDQRLQKMDMSLGAASQ